MANTHEEIDLHRLELRFTATRLTAPGAVEHLVQSIECDGQLVPCIAVSDSDQSALILLDGYRRIEALRRLGLDTVRVEIWDRSLAQGLLSFFAHHGHRSMEAIEEGLLLQELTQSHGMSQRDVARQIGRDVSWVNRRITLVTSLPDSLLKGVRAGTLTPWAATRIMAPLARANTEHASAVLNAITASPLTSRELALWFDHYQQATRTVRERMAAQPHLFIQSEAAAAEHQADDILRNGPEGRLKRELRTLLATLRRVQQALPHMVQIKEMTADLYTLRTLLTQLQNELNRNLDHDPDHHP